jgi:BirA family biotin operon repressor/biotin-[acetyl-CoA-carboxylase] ligase|tara:strand:+ start:1530 stop:2558 length:1029 start_codon:yes stop_codon:yes gene_type:complete
MTEDSERPPTHEHLLTLLLDATGDFVAGRVLEDRLKVSRPAIHQIVEKLRGLGFEIEARRHSGYRLLREPLVSSALLYDAYQPLVLGAPKVYYFEEIDSTNSAAERLLSEGSPTPFVVVAGSQTAGRGRLGRRWHSPSGGDLYASFAFHPRRPPRDMPSITLWFGLAIAQFLKAELGLDVKVKWPNDLILDERKLAGMLTEARVDADQIRDLVFGIGLNVLSDPEEWPPEVRAVATSLRRAGAEGLIEWRHRFLVRLFAAVCRAYNTFMSGTALEELVQHWPEFDALCGRTVEVHSPKEARTGVVEGIDREGQLCLRMPDGGLESFFAGEVTIGSGKVKKGD